MKNLILIFFLFSTILCSSQKKDEVKITKKIKSEACNFLIKKGEIVSRDSLDTKISIIEILDKKILGYNSKGIYRLFPHKSPSFTYIILKDGEKFKIIDLKNFSMALNEISIFFNASKFDDNKIVEYMEKILETYRNNDYGAKIRW